MFGNQDPAQGAQGGLMGLLNSPAGQGLLAAGLGAMGSRGNTMQAIGRGGLLGMSTYGQAQEQRDNKLLTAAKDQVRKNAFASIKQGANGEYTFDAPALLQIGVKADDLSKIRNSGRDQFKEMQKVTNADGSQSIHSVNEYGGIQNTGLTNAAEIKAQDLGGNMAGINPYTGQQAWSADKSLTPDQVQGAANQPFMMKDGQIVPNPAYQSYAMAKAAAGASRTNVTVDAAPKAFWNDFGKQASDQLFKEREGAQAASSTLQGIGEIRKAVQGGAYQGAGADYKLGAAKALGALGLQIAPEQVANSEQFNAIANQFVLNSIKGLGANPSNADRDFIEKTVPRLSTDPGALPLLLNFMEGKAKVQVDGYNEKIKGVQSQAGAGFMPFSLEVKQPAAAAAGGGARRFNPATGKIE